MKIEWMGDITLMQTADGREFYVPGHVGDEDTPDVPPHILITLKRAE